MSLRQDLRTLADRPLDSSQRGLLIGSLLFLVAVAAVIWLLGGNGEPPQGDRTAGSSGAQEPVPPPPAPAPERDLSTPPSEEEELEPEEQPSSADVDAARSAARSTLLDYLEFSYGRAAPDEVGGISDELRAQLERNTPRVPADVRDRDPELVAVTTEGVTPEAAEVLALVDDGEGSYSIRVDLERDDEGWVVTSIDRA